MLNIGRLKVVQRNDEAKYCLFMVFMVVFVSGEIGF